MKFWMIIAVCCLAVSAGAQTYRAGGAARANFGAQQGTEEKKESSVPGARSNVQTRTFSNYSSRQPREWSKGVQTQGVRTSTAGSAEYVDKADERAARAAEALGAEGVQMGTRFALTEESSAHFNFKDRCLRLNEGDTLLTLKQLSPTRLVKNDFYKLIEEAEQKGASADELKALLGKGRAKKGIFEGDLYEGELEIGQAASQLRKLQTVDEVMKELVEDYRTALRQMQDKQSW